MIYSPNVPTCSDLFRPKSGGVGTLAALALSTFARFCSDRSDRFPYIRARTHTRARAHVRNINIGRNNGTKPNKAIPIKHLQCSDLPKTGRNRSEQVGTPTKSGEPMQFKRTHNRIWRSTCNRYEINAIIQPDGSFTYAAMHVRTPKHLIGLGLYAGLDSVTNAQAAKQACANHLGASCS